jgi:hypothetical protein
MNLQEAGQILAKAAAYDRRTIGQADVLAWHEALSDMDATDALAAVAAHYRDSTEWLMPAHVRRQVAELARQRRRADLDAAHDRAIVSAPTTRTFRRPVELIAALRATLPPGDPAKLRGPHWLATHAQRQLRGVRHDAPSAPAVGPCGDEQAGLVPQVPPALSEAAETQMETQ